jgi:hypothetical protein
MKHRSTRELFDYWNMRRGRRSAPERSEIEPAAIRRALADTFILSFDTRAGHPFRIAGTRVCALFSRELKAESFVRLWAREHAGSIGGLLEIVAQESVGVVAGVSATGANGERLDLELLALPLAHHGRTDTRVLGTLVPIGVPYWLGVHPIGRLALSSHRYLGTTAVPAAARPLPLAANAHVRHGLVVYDGGQA